MPATQREEILREKLLFWLYLLWIGVAPMPSLLILVSIVTAVMVTALNAFDEKDYGNAR